MMNWARISVLFGSFCVAWSRSGVILLTLLGCYAVRALIKPIDRRRERTYLNIPQFISDAFLMVLIGILLFGWQAKERYRLSLIWYNVWPGSHGLLFLKV